MVDALTSDGYLDAAKETESILLILSQFEVMVGARLDRLTPVWKAVEWHRSGDSGPDDIADEIAKYRKAAGLALTMTKGKILENDPIDKAWSRLREQAIQAGMIDLAIAYGWSQIKHRSVLLERIINGEQGKET